MDARWKEIEHLESEIRRLEGSITSECVDIGRRTASLAPPGAANEELLKYLNSVRALRRAADAARDDIDRIGALARRIRSNTQEIEENRRAGDQLLRERAARFGELGTGSYAVFKTLTDREPYRLTFEDLLKIDLETEHKHEALKQLEAERQGKGMFARLKYIPRQFGLRSDIDRLEKAKGVAYERAGARAAESDFARYVEGPLRQLFDAIQDRKRAADALVAENDLKAEGIERDRQELKRLGALEGAEEKTREIERRIASTGKEMDVMHSWIGQLFLERDLRREINDGGLDAKFEIVAGLRESIRKKRRQADRMKAEMEIEEITRREKDRRGRRNMLEEEMRAREREISAIDVEINAGLRRIEDLRRVVTGEAPYTDPRPSPPDEGEGTRP